LITTIQPGQYTAQVRGKGQDSGIGVVQAYFFNNEPTAFPAA